MIFSCKTVASENISFHLLLRILQRLFVKQMTAEDQLHLSAPASYLLVYVLIYF